MKNILIEQSTREEAGFVTNKLVDYNYAHVPPGREPAYIHVNRVIKDSNGTILAGINSIIMWDCLHIDILWVKEESRTAGYGSSLLAEAEKTAKENGCKLAHLETFDFQAKNFYLKNDYEIYGVLEGYPYEHNMYCLKKNL